MMARVPTYDNLQTSIAPARPQVSGPTPGDIVADQMQRGGRAMSQAGGELQRVQLDAIDQDNQIRVQDAMNQVVAARLRYTVDKDAGFSSLQGKAALERPDGKALDQEFGDKLKGDIDSLSAGLGNDAQRRAFQMQAGKTLVEFRGEVQKHMAKESQQFALSTQEGTVKIAQDQMGLNWSNPEALAQGQRAIKAAVERAGQLQGWAPEMVAAKQVESLSQGHAAVIGGMLQADKIDAARAYMDQVKAELTPQARLTIDQHLKAATTAQQGMAGAADIWTTLGPKADGSPVEMDKMEAQAREKFGDKPEIVKAVIGELRERAAAFNSSEKERAAGNVNTVMLAYSKGMPLAKLKAMPEFTALPGEQQNSIIQHVTDRAHMLWARGLEDQQRIEALQQKRAYPAFLEYSNPTVLGNMTRAQVTALQPVLGNQMTEHLVSRWDTMQTRDAKLQASMDQQDFDHVADQLGLKPFATNKNEDQKRQLGELKFRVEQLIDRAQATKRGPLERGEKMELMRQEMARTVAVPTWFGMSSEQVPVIQLTPKQAGNVAVPDGDRALIVQALKTMAARDPANPAFEPTEANVRRMYLLRQSPAGALVPMK